MRLLSRLRLVTAFVPVLLAGMCLPTFAPASAVAPEPERQYLSGRGPADAIPWEFTITAGRRAGEATTIPVPSNWELQGFGAYHYGQQPNKSAEHGRYRTRFNVPAAWKGQRVRLVFDGAMTDTAAVLNGRSAGPTHQGGFTRFRYEVSSLLKFGAGPDNENILEVDVAKVSTDPDTERGERFADYWVFGGLYRAVWLEALPAQAIEHVALDARADGALTADVALSFVHDADRIEAQVFTAEGKAFGSPFRISISGGGAGRVQLATRLPSPLSWTAETPHLYMLHLALLRGDETLHRVSQRFGFRTFEVRDGEGLFLNGQRILLKGVNRHSFRPATGRALSREDCYADTRLIRSMNMNAVRMSHYPPDEAFLEACDELGLYVLDELSGWQHAHGTPIGRLLVREVVERDVNHPSILFWDNGNERGWNRALDGDFALYDPQRRRVLHPQETFSGVDTKHYPAYDDLSGRLRGPHLVMPTEFLHGLYDGGMGAGLTDYWNVIATSPFGAGGFLWVLADEGVVRTDQGGRIDVFSTFGPDGIVGTRHEKEGSYHTVRDVWSPVQIDPPVLAPAFTRELTVHNRFDFTSLAACRFTWRLVRFDAANTTTLTKGTLPGPAVAPHASGTLTLPLPANWTEADALALTANDPAGMEVWTWTWPTPALAQRLAAGSATKPGAAPTAETSDAVVTLRAGDVSCEFERSTGMLLALKQGNATSALTQGPRLAFARPAAAAPVAWLAFADTNPTALTRRLGAPQVASTLDLSLVFDRDQSWVGVKIEFSADGTKWRTLFDATRRPGDGYTFTFPPQLVAAVRLSRLRTADERAVTLKSMRLGHAAGRFPAAATTAANVSSGAGPDAAGAPVAWVEAKAAAELTQTRWTLRGDGSLQLEYSYALEGDFLYHGVTFEHPEEEMQGLRWLGEGPFCVWQNRTRGTWLDWHETVRNDLQPGESWAYPEFAGFFAGVRRATLDTARGALGLGALTPGVYLRVGTPRPSHPQTMVDFPAGNFSLLHAIPAMGSKFKPAEVSGPSGQPARAAGQYSGTVTFRFGD